MLTIRLQRTGRKNHSNFRVVVAEKTSHVSKKFLEVLGSYNPHKKELSLKNAERLQYWISKQVQLSPTVNNLLIEKGLLKGSKVKAFNVPKKEEPKEESKAEAVETPAPEATSGTASESSTPEENQAAEEAPEQKAE